MTQVLERGLLLEAEALRGELIKARIELSAKPTEEAREETEINRDLAFLRLLEIRKLGALPFPSHTSLALSSVETPESLHEFSQNQISINFPRANDPDNPDRIRSKLSNLRKKGIAENSMDALGLLTPFQIIASYGTEVFPRTIKEIEAIDKARESIPQGENTERRRNLRELKDRLVIDRLLRLTLDQALPDATRVIVDISKGIVILRIITRSPLTKVITIENLSDKYTRERNEKLGVTLAKLGLV